MRLAATVTAASLALAACVGANHVSRSELTSTLTGHQETPGPGDLDGTGTARVTVNAITSRLCWTMAVRGIDPATAAHIHSGTEGVAGPPVMPITTPDAAGQSQGCVPITQELAVAMLREPDLFYLNVHNQPHPAGAIRGQLRGRAFIVPEPQPARR
jgi:hypothetical protein